MEWKEILENLLGLIGIGLALYYIPYLIRRGWEEGNNAVSLRRKVCDICFRDIKKVNELLNK